MTRRRKPAAPAKRNKKSGTLKGAFRFFVYSFFLRFIITMTTASTTTSAINMPMTTEETEIPDDAAAGASDAAGAGASEASGVSSAAGSAEGAGA